MAVPKKRTSHSKTAQRSSGKALKPLNIVYDKNGDPHLQHYVSSAGKYKGIVVIKKKEKKDTTENT